MAWIELQPRCRPIFRRLGLDAARSFLAWTGILVNRHRDRQVERVTFEEHGFFLKKEFAVTWRERFRNAWHGFGWCSRGVREARLLGAVRSAGIGCPEVAAFGEDRRQAFLLLREAAGMTELREFLQHHPDPICRQSLAVALGRELARMHDAGFDHPDLYAKHVLAAKAGGTFRFCVLDWQRGRRRAQVGWRLRCRDWGALDATLNAGLAGDRLRLRCLRAYLRALAAPRSVPPFGRLARQIRQHAAALQQKRKVREMAQLPVGPAQQQMVPLHDGRLLIVRSFYEELGGRLPDWLMNLDDDPLHANRRTARLNEKGPEMRLHFWELAASSAPVWELPRLAHLLFRLQSFGIPAPRLLAAGRLASRGFLLISAEPAVPLSDALADASQHYRLRLLGQAGWIARQAREAGLAAEASWHDRLGVDAAGKVIFTDIERQAVS